ncbi:MAG: hypothetical protein HQM06_00400 [Magnetococcales bacterium]|nr:hypothetical protein [Magnetococcales bacterium]
MVERYGLLPLAAALLLSTSVWAEWENALSLGLRDPSRPPAALLQPRQETKTDGSGGLALDRWQLNLLRFTGTDALAIINGKPVRAGETIDGLLVEAIHRHGVTGRADHQPVTLRMEVNRAAANMIVRPAKRAATRADSP